MKWKGIRTLAIAGLLMMAMVAAAMPAEAKTYYVVSKGTICEHYALRYEHNDIASVLQPFVDRVEYDIKYTSGPCGFGVRLYYTDEGRKSIAAGNNYLLDRMTYAVMEAPEWYRQRTFQSVKTEILMHAKWGKPEVDIEYFYSDLKYWEFPYKYI